MLAEAVSFPAFPEPKDSFI